MSEQLDREAQRNHFRRYSTEVIERPLPHLRVVTDERPVEEMELIRRIWPNATAVAVEEVE